MSIRRTLLAVACLCLALAAAARAGSGGDPARLVSLRLTGNAEDAALTPVPNAPGVFQTYVRLSRGSFRLTGEDALGAPVTLGSAGGGACSLSGGAPFAVDTGCVARVTVDARAMTVATLPVTLHVRGAMGAGNPALAYRGGGVFESRVSLRETDSQQWVDKTMYFALNNSDSLAVKRLAGGGGRMALGMASQGQRVEDILQNAGEYTLRVDMRGMTYSVSAPVDENRVSVFGSSVANGQGAEGFKGYRYLYGQELLRRHRDGESPHALYTTNVSVGGNNTLSLRARYDDLLRDFGRYVIFGLSLGNEGVHGAADRERVAAQWRDNMLALVARARSDGKVPMVMNNYTRGDFDAGDYECVKRLNLLIHEWDVPSTNVLGAIDDGAGRWAAGYMADTWHQNTAGHREFFLAMVPSLFDALKAGKPQPARDRGKRMTLPAGARLEFRPEGTLHPYTLSLTTRRPRGRLITLDAEGAGKPATLAVNGDGTLTLTTASGTERTTAAGIADDGWHTVTLTHYYARGVIQIYLDKTLLLTVAERMESVERVRVGGGERPLELSELLFWRSGMTSEEVGAVCDGRMLKSSLELYVPLGGRGGLENLAQSMNTLRYAGPGAGRGGRRRDTSRQARPRVASRRPPHDP